MLEKTIGDVLIETADIPKQLKEDKMWRPENWRNRYEYLPKHMRDEYNELPEHGAFEAGADAMLEALRRTGFGYSKDFKHLLSYPPQGKDGKLVFIPEEVDNDTG